MPARVKVRGGLCSTCDNARVCVHLRSGRGPVWHCEEFSAYTPPEVRNRKPNGRRLVANNPGPIAVRPNDLLGLCANCENWETCTFPRLEGGVWHCEEYC